MATATPVHAELSHPGLTPTKEQKMSKESGQTDHSPGYRQARECLISAAVETVLDHCSEEDRARLRLNVFPDLQNCDALIPVFNEETNQYADLIVQQAIATISILISKEYNITILK